MNYEYIQTAGKPFVGKPLEKIRLLLNQAGLSYDENVQYTTALWTREGELAAVGSLDHNVIKCIATASWAQGEGLSAAVVSMLTAHAAGEGRSHLFLYTKPRNQRMFEGMGFYLVGKTRDALLMENRRDGVARFVAGLENPSVGGPVGAIVANCNPFTEGHLHLARRAADECDLVHFFLLSEDRGVFSPEERFQLAKAGLAGLDNVLLHPTGGYLVSTATFPDYFLGDRASVNKAACEMDVEIFAHHFVPKLHIGFRYIGEEPFSPITAAYNSYMKEYLPTCGVKVVEVPRCKRDEEAVSASRVRRLLAEDKLEELRPFVPESTFCFLNSSRGKEIAEKLRK